MIKFARITLAAASIALVAVSATAQAQAVTTTTEVSIEPYQLASSAGRTAVLERIERAASRLCRPEALVDRARMKDCRTDNIERMVRQTNSPRLLAQWNREAAVRTASIEGGTRTKR